MKFIKNNWKTIIVLVVSLILFFLIKETLALRAKNKTLVNQIEYNQDSTAKELKKWKDENGNLHSTVKTLEVENEQIGLYTKELEKTLHIKSKQLKNASKVKIVTKIEKEVVHDTLLVQADSTVDEAYSYKDNYLSATYFRKGDKRFIKASMKDTLTQATYWKRKGFLGLGGKEFFSDFSNVNPNSQVTPILAVKTKDPRKPIASLAPAAGIMWGIDGKPRLSAGVVILPDFLTIKIR